MPLLSDEIRNELTEMFTKELRDPVTLHFFTQKKSLLAVPAEECPSCSDASELVHEVTALSPLLKLETHDFVAEAELVKKLGVARIPAIVFQSKGKGVARYYGIPAGYEFSVLIEDLLDLSKGQTHLSAKTQKQLAALPGPVHIQVLVTPT